MAQTILYYPKININDGIWLRNALLYWDEVASIVPYENYEDMSHELEYLQNRGVYKAIYPQDLFSSEYAEDFCNSIIKRITAYERSVIKSDKTGKQNRRVQIHKHKIYAPAFHELIHYKKIPAQLLEVFNNKKYINDYNADGWLEIDEKIAHIYMRTLAEYSIKCSDKDIVLGTDTMAHSREIYNCSRNRSDCRGQCCKINIVNCLPQPSMDVSFEDILDFKVRRKDELNAFRAKIRELEINIYNADSPELIRYYEAQFIEGWQRSSVDFYKVLKEAGILFCLGSLVSLVSIPFVEQQLLTYIGQGSTSLIQGGAQLLNIGIDYFDYKNKISPAKSVGSFSYIIKANKEGIIHV